MECDGRKGRKEAKMYPFCQSTRFNAMFLSTDYQTVTKNLQVFSARNISH